MPGETLDPQGLWARTEEYLEWLAVRAYSPETMRVRRAHLSYFASWCDGHALTRPQELTKPILERYQRHLFYHRKKNGKPLSAKSQAQRLMSIKQLFRWLTQQNIILYNPASELELPRPELRLPRHVLTPAEAEAVLAQPDVRLTLGLRDRAILETFYATGVRRTEMARLKVSDLNEDGGTLHVRQGKGKRDRVVPVGERAMAWIRKYLADARPELVIAPDDGSLFVSRLGCGFVDPRRLTMMVRRYVKAADLGKVGACHIFRHSMATAMLNNGADIRFIQQMLGHANLTTTEIYTRVSIDQLRRVHSLTHPAANLHRREPAQDAEGSRPDAPGPDAAELYQALDEEDLEDAAEDSRAESAVHGSGRVR